MLVFLLPRESRAGRPGDPRPLIDVLPIARRAPHFGRGAIDDHGAAYALRVLGQRSKGFFALTGHEGQAKDKENKTRLNDACRCKREANAF